MSDMWGKTWGDLKRHGSEQREMVLEAAQRRYGVSREEAERNLDKRQRQSENLAAIWITIMIAVGVFILAMLAA